MKSILLFLLPSFLFACAWIDGTTIDGQFTKEGRYLGEHNIKYSIEHSSPKTKLAKIQAQNKRDTLSELERREYDAVILLLQGQYAQSITQLLLLEEENPNQYTIASNLGTAYELLGNNQKALKWITEGLKRNPTSHYGSEWIHKHILKMKIKLERSPNFLNNHRLFPLPKNFNFDTNVTIKGSNYTIRSLSMSLEYQLQERTVFVKPKDKVVADLLYTLARISAQASTVEEALKYLELSERYGFSNPELLKEKRDLYRNIKNNTTISYTIQKWSNIDIIFYISLFSLLLIIAILVQRLLLFIYRKLKS